MFRQTVGMDALCQVLIANALASFLVLYFARGEVREELRKVAAPFASLTEASAAAMNHFASYEAN
ncbi:MAG TPA: hypothetical protein EYN66_07595 [Myxococcales bacterium]|nr:hypothetical protein [Myxococcales bacterium]